MISLTSFFRKVFCVGKQVGLAEPSPPPYDFHCASEKNAPSIEKSLPFLNPGLKFTAAELEAHLSKQDTRFAAAVVELMLPRLKLGVWQEPVGWGHYSYEIQKVSTHFNNAHTQKDKDAGCHSEICQCNKATGWDNIIGFKAWDYASRFAQVSKLVRRDLEFRGFEVRKVEVYTHKCTQKSCRGGVFVKWDVRFPGENDEETEGQDL